MLSSAAGVEVHSLSGQASGLRADYKTQEGRFGGKDGMKRKSGLREEVTNHLSEPSQNLVDPRGARPPTGERRALLSAMGGPGRRLLLLCCGERRSAHDTWVAEVLCPRGSRAAPHVQRRQVAGNSLVSYPWDKKDTRGSFSASQRKGGTKGTRLAPVPWLAGDILRRAMTVLGCLPGRGSGVALQKGPGGGSLQVLCTHLTKSPRVPH